MSEIYWLLSSDKEPYAESFENLPTKDEIFKWMIKHDLDVCWLNLYADNVSSETLFEFTRDQNGRCSTLDIFALKKREEQVTGSAEAKVF